MKKFAIIFVAAILSISATDKTPQRRYIEKYSEIAVQEMHRTGVPASITLAQGILESRSGQSALAVEANNHFGIKCHRDWTGETMLSDDDVKNDCFRKYRNPEESFRDHSDFLRYRDRYKSLFALPVTDYKAWAKGLKSAGYATDPAYAGKLISLIEEYELYKFDSNEISPDIIAPQIAETPVVISASEKASRYREICRFSLDRPVYSQNGVPFIYAAEGETYEAIALSFNLFRKELLGFNDLRGDAPLKPGQVVYLARKKNQAAKGVEKYVVENDDANLWEIAQKFAVRQSAILRLNNISDDYIPKEGDTLILRKH